MVMMNSEPPRPSGPPQDAGMSGIVARNIRALLDVRRQEERTKSRSERLADAVTAFAGSMRSVYAHAAVFGAWIAVNLGWLPLIRPFDPSFVVLAMIASVEAIFLSTFIMISQNRMQAIGERRAELDLQISLLTEHELTRAIHLLDAIAVRTGAQRPSEDELQELKRDVSPVRVAEEISRTQTPAELTEPP
jgi:uncharacterized membrane protein